ncbi:ABC-type transport auxiliary lipoprotein family protein [Mesorhizobium xinjiangense]|uniref:ABC-type transport auxiliary lipoprotein family protein n=1 Tax=Mesorhizobium xinjiangense TaxID=2678685 RepID=UPI001F218DA1|nr:ABC-type transport auxiliary lipoprotein family protein [Mesorhizobium xinjiangense]
MRNTRNTVLATILAATLSGCALLPGGGPAPLDTFELTAPQVVAARASRSRTQVLVAEPTALKSLDSQNIVIRPGSGSVAFLKGAQWSDRLPRIVQARLAEALQRSGGFGGVGKPGEGLAIDYQVIVDVRSFDISLAGGDQAHVGLFVRILNDRNGVVRATRLFEARSPLTGRSNADYAAALDRAFGQAAMDITDWVNATI